MSISGRGVGKRVVPSERSETGCDEPVSKQELVSTTDMVAMSQIVRATRFLTELGQLSKRYGMEIGGCGDCGSPWVLDSKAIDWRDSQVGEYLKMSADGGYSLNHGQDCQVTGQPPV